MTSAGRPPLLSNRAVSRVVCKYFNFKNVKEDSVKVFPSYEDRNYYFWGECQKGDSSEFVLKLLNPMHTSFEKIKGITGFMKHIHSCGFQFSTPYPQASKEGIDVIQLNYDELMAESGVTANQIANPELNYPVLISSFIKGELFDHVEKKFLTNSLLYDIGRKIGTFHRDIMGSYTNKSLELRNHYGWELFQFLDMKQHLQEIDDPVCKSNAAKIFEGFKENVSPKLPLFRTGMIHGDLNGLNIILKHVVSTNTYHLEGVIDFGDCNKSCTVFDLGIALAYIMLENMKPVHCSSAIEFVGPLIGGYSSIYPLTSYEMDSLYWLILSRCIQSAVNGEMAFKVEPWNNYLLTTPKKAWELIEYMMNVTKVEVDRVWKSFIIT